MRTFLFLLASLPAAAAITAEQTEFFQKKIQPILAENCFKCHSTGQGKTKGGLALDSAEGITKGGEGGQTIVPGDPAASDLIQRVLSQDAKEKMPPKDATLTPAEVADLTAWVKMGAPYAAPKGIATGTYNSAKAKAHWAWQPLKPIAVPAVKDVAWPKNAIDNFVLAKLEAAGMKPNAPADRATLIRRAYFDMIGLPPQPWEVQAFVDDTAPGAWEKVVDRLLASPHYGERWGRHWLDVARYSDTKGDVARREDPRYVDAWTYRDWVIDATNRDLPWDQFITQQLAGDRLVKPDATDKKPLAALGFLTIGDRFNGNRNDIINDRIDAVTKGFLGLTVSCARCHDHMFDPIPQKDYYSLHGIFSSTEEPRKNPTIAARGTPEQIADFEKQRGAAEKIAMDFVRGEFADVQKIFREHTADFLMATATQGAARAKYTKKLPGQPRQLQDLLQYFSRQGARRLREHAVLGPWFRFAALDEKGWKKDARELAGRIASADKVHPQIAAQFQGEPPASLEEVAQKYGAVFAKVAANANAGGEWAALAHAPFPNDPLADFDPATDLRILGNRVAQRYVTLLTERDKVDLTHPGAPRRAMAVEDVEKPRNSPVFIRGEANNRGEIAPRRFLEILSPGQRAEFTDGSGRLELAQAIAAKTNPLTPRVAVNRIWLHHFGEGIVTTPDDFGTMSAPPSHAELLDFLAQGFVAGGWSQKKLHKAILLSATYAQSSETNAAFADKDPANRLLWRAHLRRLDFEGVRDSLLHISGKLDLAVGGQPVNILSEPFTTRRSVYGYIDRANLPEMMAHFDFANPSMPSGKRHETTVPQQALFMMNSPLMVDVARRLLARKEMAQAKDDAQRIHALYWMIFQRPPRETETKLGLTFLAATPAENAAAPTALASAAPPKLDPRRMSKEQKKAQAQNKRYGTFSLVNPGEKVDRSALTPWEKYTQALMMGNEMVYVN